MRHIARFLAICVAVLVASCETAPERDSGRESTDRARLHGDHEHDAAHGGAESGPVVAEVGGESILLSTFDRRIQLLPESVRTTLEDPDRQLAFLAQLVDELVVVQAAEDMGLDREPEFEMVLRDTRRQLLAQYYYDHVVRPAAWPDSTELAEYYASNPEQFRVSERVTGRQVVLETAEEAAEVRRLLAASMPFDSLLARSTDLLTRNLGGSIGIVSRGVPVRGVGPDEEFVGALMLLDAGDVSQPLRTKLGYHVVLVESHDAERMRPLSLVRESLERRVNAERLRDFSQSTLDSLRAAARITIHDEVLRPASEDSSADDTGGGGESAQVLFERAQATESAADRLRIYDEIESRFPESRHAAQALFMRGFVLIEELERLEDGVSALRELIQRYPDSELVDSARWMLENIDKDVTDG